MARIPISIIHLCGFLLTVLLSVFIFAKVSVIGSGGGIAEVKSLLAFKHTGNLLCQVPPSLPQSSKVQYSCDRTSCHFSIFEPLDHQIIKSFKAIDNSGTSIIDINNVFSDDARKIISFTTTTQDLSSRIIMNYDGELLQSVDETPGKNRKLIFLGYQPQSGMLVYHDAVSNDHYFYQVDSLYFARRKCP